MPERAMRGPALLLLVYMLAGCGAVDSFKSMARQTGRTADILEQALGVRPRIGWKVHNGSLEQVSVAFRESAAPDLPLSELADNVRDAVAMGFDEQPRELLVSVTLGRR
jgi:hypothetical protein